MSQSKLEWTIDTSPGNHVAAIRWCACGGLTYPGVNGRWLGKNMRRTYSGATLPVWHRAMLDLHGGPATVFARPRDLPQHADVTETIVGSQTGRATVGASAPPSPPAARPPHPVRASPAARQTPPQWRHVA